MVELMGEKRLVTSLGKSLSRRIGRVAYAEWFHTVLFEKDDDTLYVTVTHQATADRINTQYHDALLFHAEKMMGVGAGVDVRVGSVAPPPPPPKPPLPKPFNLTEKLAARHGGYIGRPRKAEFVRTPIKFKTIMDEVARAFDLTPAQIASKNRSKLVVAARGICIYLARQLTTHSYPELARLLGGTNHSSAITAFQRVEGQMGRKALLPRPILGFVTIDELVHHWDARFTAAHLVKKETDHGTDERNDKGGA
jgi:chromosomal replication initiation ATPase DnaA